MTVLVDTPVIVDHLRNDPRAVGLMDDLFAREERVWAATPTRTEILAGVRPHEFQPMGPLFSIISWIDIDRDIADAAGGLAREYHASLSCSRRSQIGSSQPVDLEDVWRHIR